MKKLTLTDLLIERKKIQEKYFKHYLDWAKKIKKQAQRELGEVKVYIFGSIIKNKVEPGSDIDLLIISPKLKSSIKKSKVRVKILEKIGPVNPFEIHLITPNDYKSWYSHFIKEKIEV